MEPEKAKGYGVAMSDFEGGWNSSFKSKLKKTSKRIISEEISFFQKIKLMYWFIKEKRKSANLGLIKSRLS